VESTAIFAADVKEKETIADGLWAKRWHRNWLKAILALAK
jgi:hypothetical protein